MHKSSYHPIDLIYDNSIDCWLFCIVSIKCSIGYTWIPLLVHCWFWHNWKYLKCFPVNYIMRNWIKPTKGLNMDCIETQTNLQKEACSKQKQRHKRHWRQNHYVWMKLYRATRMFIQPISGLSIRRHYLSPLNHNTR